MTNINSLILEVADLSGAQLFYKALGLEAHVRLRESDAPTTGFRGFHVSVIVSQPADADRLVEAALDAGATSVKPPKKSLWGYGGVVQAPDGTIWKAVSESRNNTGPATGTINEIVLLLGPDDVRASKQFYVDRGFEVAKSFGGKYVEFETGPSPIKLGLLKRQALAKDAGVPAEGTGSHRLVIGTDGEPFTDLDGFAWETV